jgi:hypothetical protein
VEVVEGAVTMRTFKELLKAFAFPYILLGCALALVAYLPYALAADGLARLRAKLGLTSGASKSPSR